MLDSLWKDFQKALIGLCSPCPAFAAWPQPNNVVGCGPGSSGSPCPPVIGQEDEGTKELICFLQRQHTTGM